MLTIGSYEEFEQYIGKELGVSEYLKITQEQINLFADATLDHQWIHVDVEKAKQGPFGGPIAHGFLTLSLIPVLSGSSKYMPEGIKMAINYGLNKVRFINPVPAGSRVRSRMVLSGIEERSGGRIMMTTTHNIEIEGQDKPACVAESLALFYV